MRTKLICLSLVLLFHSISTHSFFNVTTTDDDPTSTPSSHGLTEGQAIAGWVILGLLTIGGCWMVYKIVKKPTKAELIQRRKGLDEEAQRLQAEFDKEKTRIVQEQRDINWQLRKTNNPPLLLLKDPHVELAPSAAYYQLTDE